MKRRAWCAVAVLLAAALWASFGIVRAQVQHSEPTNGQQPQQSDAGDEPVQQAVLRSDLTEPITIAADFAQEWREDGGYVGVLRRNCFVSQGLTYVRANEAVVWIEQGVGGRDGITRVVVFLEGNVRIDRPEGTLSEPSYLIDLETRAPLQVKTGRRIEGPARHDPLFLRALARRGNPRHAALPTEVAQAQFFTEPDEVDIPLELEGPLDGQDEDMPPPTGEELPPGTRRLRAAPRSTVPFHAETFRQPDGEQVVVVTGGINLLIEGAGQFGLVDVLTDRLVLWTSALESSDLAGENLQSQETPLELYLEGNVVLRQGPRVVHASRMYYDVRQSQGVVLDGELHTFAPQFGGPIRIRADEVRQLAQGQFYAREAWFTTSKFGKPGYRFQASDAYVQETQEPVLDPFTLGPAIDPETGEQLMRTRRTATGWNNILYLEDIPVFYWPVMATDLEDPNPGIRRVRVRNDNIFGTQLLTDWNLYDLLGIADPPENTELGLDLDYLSDRGFGAGIQFDYLGENLFSAEDRYDGFLETWWIDDHGSDNLGRGRKNLDPEADTRGRFLWRHRHRLPEDFTLRAEVSWLSDRNFLEQYYEKEFDTEKDQETLVYLKQQRDNWAWSILARKRIVDSLTTTDWLPRLDHYMLGEPLLGDCLTYFTHSSVGYARLRTASTPENAADVAAPLPWEVSTNALRGATRHEIDYPFPVGPVRFVPYGLGEFAGWTNDIFGDETGRAYGMAGVRGSVPFWRVYPYVEDSLWNVHGLAHKIVLEWDYSIAGSNIPFTDLPLFDEIDDDATEAFRRRFSALDYGGMIPPMFEERFYAIRSGLPAWVTSPSTEVADDMQALRAGIHQRLQTKRGPEHDRHIIDWMTLDVDAAWFPNEDRDNFGDPFGLIGYDYSWHIGDRTAIISGGLWDTFEDGQNLWNIGLHLDRPPRGRFALTYHLLQGPIGSQIVSLRYDYVLSPKWIVSLANQVDLEEDDHNIGQWVGITRVGADFIVRLGAKVDGGKESTGVSLTVQPRFAPQWALGKARGLAVPVEGYVPFE